MILILILAIVFIIFIICGIISDSDYGNHIAVNGTKISFKTFEAMYDIKPEAWELEKTRIVYKKPHYTTLSRIDGTPYKMWLHDDRYYFFFSFRDYCKYRKFLSRLEDLKIQKIEYEKMKKITEHFKEDIEEYKKTHEEEVVKKLKEINQIGYEIKSNDGTNYFCLKRRGK